MKRIVALLGTLVLALTLVACGKSELGVNSDDDGIHAVATGRAEGSANGNITITDGYGLCINHIVEKGSFHVKATDQDGTVVFDKDITDNIADMVPVTGEFEVVITANKATGTIDIIAYDKEAMAQSEETLPDALAEAGLSEEEVGIANPWTDAETAEAAGEGAGVGYFIVPEENANTSIGPINWFGFQYMNMLAEADGAVGAAELTVRKGVKNPADPVDYDTSDVSGDYTAYAHEWQMEVGDWEVTCFGNEDGKTMKAIWTSNNFSYAIMVRGQGDEVDTFGLGAEDTAAIVEAVE